MNDRTKNNLVLILLLFIEIVAIAGFYYLAIYSIAWTSPAWVYYLLEITSIVFGSVLLGISIGSLSSQEDVWKFAIGIMVIATTANVFQILIALDINWLFVTKILLLLACNTIISLVTYFASQSQLRKYDLIVEQPELTDEELTLLESITS